MNHNPGSRHWLKALVLLLCGFAVLQVRAADIQVQIKPPNVVAGQPFKLVFVLEGDQSGEPDFSPLSKDFSLHGTSTSNQFSMINGNMRQSRQYQLNLVALKAGTLTIPSIHFGKDVSPEQKIEVAAGGAQAPQTTGEPAGEDILVFAEVDETNPYVQQQVLVTVKILRRINWQQAALSELQTATDVLVQQLGEDKSYQIRHDDRTYAVVERKFALFPQQSGELELAPFTLTAAVSTGGQNRGQFQDFFSRGRYEQKVAQSEVIKLNVKPVPQAFSGRHWLIAKNIKLQENWSADLESLKTGDSSTRTIAVIADGLSVGQLPQINMPAIDGIKIYPDQPLTHEQNTVEGLLSTATHKFAMIPSRAGNYLLPEINVPWWNSETDQMEVAKLPATKLQVAAVQAAQSQLAAPEPAPTETVEKVSSEQPLNEVRTPVNSWLFAAVLMFAGFWVITLIAWYRARLQLKNLALTHASAIVRGAEVQTAIAPEMKSLEKACVNKDAATVRDAVLSITRTLWPNETVTSLEDVQKKVNPELAHALVDLNRHLYSPEQTEWDPGLIMEQMKDLVVQMKGRSSEREAYDLEPLYR